MHRIKRIFNSENQRVMNLNQRQQQHKQRKLQRRNAVKNSEYQPSPSSLSWNFSSSSEELTAASAAAEKRTRSLDLSRLGDKKSFRIEGNEGEFELICESLGFSGTEDFAIPIAAWEDMMVRSASDVLPRSIGLQFDIPKAGAPAQLAEMEGRFVDNCRVGDAIELKTEHSDSNNCVNCHGGGGNEVEVCGLADKLEHRAVITANSAESGGAGGSRGDCGGSGGGIKGVRPPVLAPPPLISLPVIDNECSTWDLLKSFAPNDGRGLIIGGLSSSDEEEEEEEEEEVIEEIVKGEATTWQRVGENGIISASCSFTTTSNDDDSSSTTTEPLSNVSPNGRFKRIIAHWDKGELLGRGSFGSVYEGIDVDGLFFAVKEVSLLDQGDQARQSIYQLEQEIALLSQFEHENIVQYYGTDKDESNLYIFLEFVTKGSLLSLYQKYHLRDSQVSAYTRQILHGLKYLHDRNVVHRDIKCANILVDANGSVKLADFGLAKATKLNDVKSCKGTAFWMAPEVVRTQGYGLAADIWSLGCTVLEMLTQQIPYSHLECMQALFRIGRGEPPPVPDTLSRDAQDFIFKCLQVNPKFRPTAAQLLDHPFVKRPLPLCSASASPYNFGRRG